MPITVTAPEGVLTEVGTAEILPRLTAALVDALGGTGNAFVEEIVGGTVHILSPRDVYAGGRRQPVVMVEVKLPNPALPEVEDRSRFIELTTTIVRELAVEGHADFHTWVNIINAPDGGWGFSGTTWTNERLGTAITTGQSPLHIAA